MKRFESWSGVSEFEDFDSSIGERVLDLNDPLPK